MVGEVRHTNIWYLYDGGWKEKKKSPGSIMRPKKRHLQLWSCFLCMNTSPIMTWFPSCTNLTDAFLGVKALVFKSTCKTTLNTIWRTKKTNRRCLFHLWHPYEPNQIKSTQWKMLYMDAFLTHTDSRTPVHLKCTIINLIRTVIKSSHLSHHSASVYERLVSMAWLDFLKETFY